MTASRADTAELPRVPTTRDALAVDVPSGLTSSGTHPGSFLPSVPLVEPAPTAALTASSLTVPSRAVLSPTAPGPGRAALRAERRALRRQRRLDAALGLLVLAVTLGATVTVLEVVH
jgi:hypothetical protein